MMYNLGSLTLFLPIRPNRNNVVVLIRHEFKMGIIVDLNLKL